MRHRRRGYALPFVLTVLIMLGLGSMLVLYVLTAGIAETRRAMGEQRIFYACDSAIRIASRVSESVVLANPRLPAAEVTAMTMDAICDAAGGCAGARTVPLVGGNPEMNALEYLSPAPGVAVGPDALMPDHSDMERFYLKVQPLTSVNTVQVGAFRDMFATQSTVSIRVQGIHRGTGTVTGARDTFQLATLTPFQLMVFSNAPLNWAPSDSRVPFIPPTVPVSRVGPSIYVDGPVTVGGGTLNLTRVVATGAITGGGGARIWDGNLTAPSYLMFPAPPGGWANQIRTPLTLSSEPQRKQSLPVTERPRSTRWLLDPPIVGAGGDNAAAQQAKLAMQADIRIIDGVWFIKPPTGSAVPEWPGIPIWSDHAGANVEPQRTEARLLMTPPGGPGPPLVGQLDLQDLHDWISTPRRFSYYEADATGMIIPDPGNVGVVFYGMAKKKPGGPGLPIGPGVLAQSPPPPATTGMPCQIGGSPYGAFRYWDECPDDESALLDGARYGFRDYSALQGDATRSNVLPLNFDVAQFFRAMEDGRPGELGSYFCGAPTLDTNNAADVPPAGCRIFNGIVWITATWPGSLKGLVDAANADPSPRQGVDAFPYASGAMAPVLDPALRPTPGYTVAAGTLNFFLPEQLCSGTALQGNAMEATGRFRAIGCDRTVNSAWDWVYGTALAVGVRPNPTVTAVRLLNGSDMSAIIDREVPQRYGNQTGLSIATNLPLYVNGDFNVQTGAPFITGVACPAPGGPVPPQCILPRMMVAGDIVSFQSQPGAGDPSIVLGGAGYNDGLVRWGSNLNIGGGPGSPGTLITARQTTYVVAVMTGAPQGATENAESYFRVQERWDLTGGGRPTMRVIGALYVSGRSVYRTDRQAYNGGYLPVPRFEWQYNPSLSTLNQPPGTPRFLIGVSNRWRDLRESPELQ